MNVHPGLTWCLWGLQLLRVPTIKIRWVRLFMILTLENNYSKTAFLHHLHCWGIIFVQEFCQLYITQGKSPLPFTKKCVCTFDIVSLLYISEFRYKWSRNVTVSGQNVKETVWIKSIRVTLNGKPITSLGSHLEKHQAAQVNFW